MVAAALLIFAIVALALGPLADVIESFDGERISGWIEAAGIWGPILIVSLMTIAIVATPIPSAPIALAAGAAYGHTLGTVYIVAGAELGALVAFGLARVLGRDVLVGWLGCNSVCNIDAFLRQSDTLVPVLTKTDRLPISVMLPVGARL